MTHSRYTFINSSYIVRRNVCDGFFVIFVTVQTDYFVWDSISDFSVRPNTGSSIISRVIMTRKRTSSARSSARLTAVLKEKTRNRSRAPI